MEELSKVIIIRQMVGMHHMQVCAHKDATDKEILEVCNAENSSGTTLVWTAVVHEVSDAFSLTSPVTCEDDQDRIHYLVSCH